MGWAPVRRVTVRGPSMAPTLADGDLVLAVRLPVRVGHVVLVSWESRPGQLSVKRAVRAVGDRWHVEGDFAEVSTDSRVLGPATVHAVITRRLRPGRTRLRRT
ncbi:S26 family signal peptidase [Actinokineospora pegani]|uniref:S26 family signal peptidase n=1 Tax=Actinokineospora pegani TaxID=2654637 RepID=UPI0012EA90FB|nr:S26 family signal peptidase [Actinokineospora pegani]